MLPLEYVRLQWGRGSLEGSRSGSRKPFVKFALNRLTPKLIKKKIFSVQISTDIASKLTSLNTLRIKCSNSRTLPCVHKWDSSFATPFDLATYRNWSILLKNLQNTANRSEIIRAPLTAHHRCNEAVRTTRVAIIIAFLIIICFIKMNNNMNFSSK